MSEHEDRWPGPGLSGNDPQSPEQPLASARASEPERTGPTGELPRSRGEARATSRRIPGPPWLVWAVLGAVVVIAAVVAALLLLGGDDEPAASPAPTVTNTLPAPTPTTEPVDRGEGTALFTAMPGTVRQYVLTATGPGDALSAAGAIEAYTFTYSGALEEADAVYTVEVGQWATPEEATAAATALTAGLGTVSSTGDVLVDGAVAGTYSLVGTEGADPAHAVWTNGTLVLHASGPAADIENVYLAFGL